MTRNSFRKLSFILTAVVLFSTLYLSTTYATLAPLTPPPSGGYDAGSNSILDPGCIPGATDCFVKEFEGWKLTGNAGTTAGTNFIGTTDAEDFVIKVNGNEMGRFYESTGASAGSVALGGGTALSESMFVFGVTAGASATNAIWSNFIGYSAGQLAINASYSNFIGLESGNGATSANNSNFLGQSAGEGAVNANQSNFIGWAAGGGAVNAHDSNFFGYQSGNGAVDAAYANFFGFSAGLNADEANDSNFFGNEAGSGATAAYNSNFFGTQAGYLATDASYANFLGQAAGKNALFAQNSNFMGRFAGQDALSAQNSNFFGQSAGEGAIGASYSNFFGPSAGVTATNAQYSNFFGANAGYGATQAQNSNFFGQNTGATAVNAANSIFIGVATGNGDLVNNTTDPDDYSILIGNYASTGDDGFGVGFSNSIALGAYATNTASNQFMIGSATRPIDEIVMVSTGGTTCATDINGTACSSDERLKTNITDLANTTLDTLLNVKTVTFNWNNNTDTANHIGFIAQDIQQYFPELVSTGSTGYLSVNYAGMTPVIVEAIREMNLKITDINNTAVSNTWRDALIAWFGNIENGITNMYVKVFHADRVETKELCIDDVCITKDQLQTILNSNQIAPSPSPAPVPTIGDDSAPSGNDDQTPPIDNPSDDGTNSEPTDSVPIPPTDTPAPNE